METTPTQRRRGSSKRDEYGDDSVDPRVKVNTQQLFITVFLYNENEC